MALKQTLESLRDLAQKSLETGFESGDSLIFRFECRDQMQREIDQTGLPYDRIGADKISIALREIPGLFYDSKDFRSQSVDTSIFGADIGILNHPGSPYLYFDHAQDRIYSGTFPDPSNRLIPNTRDYWKFYEYFNSSEISEYNSSVDRRFILVSPEKGKFYLGYPDIPPEFSNEMDLSRKYARLEQVSPSQEFRLLFEMQIIESLSSCPEERRFQTLIENLEAILRRAENDYQAYLNKFSFEKLRNEFRQARDRHFANFRTILDQLLSKVVSIPISISAAALAIYNLRNEPNYSAVVAVAFVVYSLFTAYLLRLLHVNVFEISQDLEDDIGRIKRESNLEESEIERETAKIGKKIRLLHGALIVLQFLLAGLSLAVLSIYFQFLAIPWNDVILWLILLLGLHLLLAFAWLNPKAKRVSTYN
jgi:hypothetical protein